MSPLLLALLHLAPGLLAAEPAAPSEPAPEQTPPVDNAPAKPDASEGTTPPGPDPDADNAPPQPDTGSVRVDSDPWLAQPGAGQPEPAPVVPAAPTTGAERRQQERKAKRELLRSLPQREADFLRTHTDLKLRLAFNGYTPGPFSLVTSLAGWNELSLTLDSGIANWRDFTVGFGGTLHYGQALILGAITQPIANYDETQFRWSMWETGGTLRGTLHYNALQSVDPYLMIGAGAGNFHLEARVRDWPLATQQRRNIPYLRIEVGAGLSTYLRRSNWVIGGELRYLVSTQFGAEQDLLISHPDGSTATFSLFPQHKPPKGFSWMAHVGYRF